MAAVMWLTGWVLTLATLKQCTLTWNCRPNKPFPPICFAFSFIKAIATKAETNIWAIWLSRLGPLKWEDPFLNVSSIILWVGVSDWIKTAGWAPTLTFLCFWTAEQCRDSWREPEPEQEPHGVLITSTGLTEGGQGRPSLLVFMIRDSDVKGNYPILEKLNLSFAIFLNSCVWLILNLERFVSVLQVTSVRAISPQAMLILFIFRANGKK